MRYDPGQDLPKVYPRVGGETSCHPANKGMRTKFTVYPRVGGETNGAVTSGLRWRSTPAWAGKPHPLGQGSEC